MKRILRMLFVCFGLLFMWQGIVWYSALPPYILPSPWQVLLTLHQQAGLLFTHTLPTLIETCVGYILGVLFGCLAAILIVFFKPLKKWFLPLLIISQAIPIFAIAPLLVIWFGYGMASKIAVTILMIFFPITSAFHDGLIRTEQGWLDLAKTMNSKRWRLFCTIRIPAALPALGSGMRLAAVAAPIGAIIGEWVGSSRGLGYLMINANARLQIDLMFAALFIIILMALALYVGIDALLRKLIWW